MPEICTESWQGRALVVGGGGIGRALSAELARRQPSLLVTLATRHPLSDQEWAVDLESTVSLNQLTEQLSADPHPL